MKKVPIIISTFFLAASTVIALFTAVNATDTSNDPLVTMSYIEEVLAPRIKNELTTYIQNNFQGQGGSVTSDDGTVIPVNTGYTVIHMKKGQVLYALESTEIILRSGKAIALSPFMDQGICDMTSGSELYNKDELPRYHYCLIPRGDDGRGIVAISDEIYIMVRGEFEIREQ